MSDVLAKILARKAEEVTERKRAVGVKSLKVLAEQAGSCRGFRHCLEQRIERGGPAVVAEIKKASPSRGVIRAEFYPDQIARSYEISGAACLSVLTDIDFFQGSDAYLREARAACALPVLRKDFIVDEYQIFEARALGADCVLLIAAALDDLQLKHFHDLANELGMDALVEVHDEVEMRRAAAIDSRLIGINNRSLRTFEVNLQTTVDLKSAAPDDALLVTESGILKPEDAIFMREHDVHAFLVGEAFMRAEDPGAELRRLFF